MKGFVNKDFKNKARFDNDRMFCFHGHDSTKRLAILNKEIHGLLTKLHKLVMQGTSCCPEIVNRWLIHSFCMRKGYKLHIHWSFRYTMKRHASELPNTITYVLAWPGPALMISILDFRNLSNS